MDAEDAKMGLQNRRGLTRLGGAQPQRFFECQTKQVSRLCGGYADGIACTFDEMSVDVVVLE